MYDFDELEKQINDVTRKQKELKKEDERHLEDAEKRLSEFFQKKRQKFAVFAKTHLDAHRPVALG